MNDVRSANGAPALGALLAGRYVVTGEARGAGIAVEARDCVVDRPVIVKLLPADAVTEADGLARFRREARVAAKMTSEHVVRILDSGVLDDTGAAYVVSERVDGSSLAVLVAARGPLPVHRAVDFALQAARAVSEAHGLGLLHGGLRTENLVLASTQPGKTVVKVNDFASALLARRSHLGLGDGEGEALDRALAESHRCKAPEQLRAAQDVDARADVYAFGAILYELLSGTRIFQADTLGQTFTKMLWDVPAPLSLVRSDVPPALERIVMRCLRKSREQRFVSVARLIDALAPFVVASDADGTRDPQTVHRSSRSDAPPPIESDAPTSGSEARLPVLASERPPAAAAVDSLAFTPAEGAVSLTLTRTEALVLFSCLTQLDGAGSLRDPSDRQAVWRIEERLERSLSARTESVIHEAPRGER